MTIQEKNKLNNDFHPLAQEVKLGDEVYNSPVIFEYAIGESPNHSTGDRQAFVAPFAMRIVSIIARATAASASGTVLPKKAAAGMCTAIKMDTDKEVIYWSAGVETAQIVLAAGDVVNVRTNGATDRGVVTFVGIRL